MNVLHWLTDHFSDRGKALSLYKRGMDRARNHDSLGAIEDYTATIGMSDAPPDLKAMSLYNRALVYVAAGDDRKGTDDLDAVLAMSQAPLNIKSMAKQKLVRMESRSRKPSGSRHKAGATQKQSRE